MVFFRFSDGKSVLQLVVELIPPGNIVLTDGEGTISLCLKEYKGLRRTIARREQILPASSGEDISGGGQ